MNLTCDKLRDPLTAVVAGRLHTLSPERVAELEAHLSHCERCSASLAGVVPAADAALRTADRAMCASSSPTQQQLAAAWTRVAAACSRGAPGGSWPIRTIWRPLLAAAACAAMVGLWRFVAPTAPEQPWGYQLARSVDIDEIEVFGDAMPFVDSTGGDDAVPVVWILDDQGA